MRHPEDVKVGDHVLFTLHEGPSKGESRPAIVVRVIHSPIVKLAVFVDDIDDLDGTLWWIAAPYSAKPEYRHWRYPEE